MENNKKTQDFAKRLNELLMKNNITQSELARKMGVSKSSVNGWCKGSTYPRIEKIIELSFIFHVDPSILITGEKPNIITVDAEKFAQAMERKNPPLLNQIAKSFAKLTNEGRQKVADYADDLTKIPQYQRHED